MPRNSTNVAWLLALGLMAAFGPGQSALTVGSKTVSLSSPGGSLGTSGLGGLKSPAPGGNVLRSSIAEPSNFTLRRSGGGAPPGLAAPDLSRSGTGISYKPQMTSLEPVGGLRPPPTDIFSGVSLLMNPTDLQGQTRLKAGEQAITSLVPAEPSEYAKHMAEGERLFRDEQFGRAFDEFLAANYAATDDSASCLAMSHAKFATGSYASAGYYLQLALRYEPELPLMPLQPRGFYRTIATYEDRLRKLHTRLETDPGDANGRLLLAYYLWFDGQQKPAWQALEGATKRIQEPPEAPDLTEAIDIFSKAMLASGQVAPTSQPSPAATPAPSEPKDGTGQPPSQDTQPGRTP